MNNKAVHFIKNMSYTVLSNLITMLVSTLVILIIPKLIGVEEYGYWQLYLFYSVYIGFLHFGWNDGIYLRYGGEEYQNLDKPLFFSQFLSLLLSQVFLGIVLWFGSDFFISNTDRIFILKMLALSVFMVNCRMMLLLILQATNRFKEFAVVTIFERTVYLILIVVMLVALGIRDYKMMVAADVLSKFVSFVYSLIVCKEIVFRTAADFSFSLRETAQNIHVGSKLMFANIVGILIIGIVRFGIERTWDVATFGKVSLTLSISNMVMVFIDAVGIILFPMLRRTDQGKLSGIYITMRDFLMLLLLGVLVLYYPLKTVIGFWLPQYADSLKFLAVVFPMLVYEGKMALLINTYLKTLRRENAMLMINLGTMLISLAVTVLNTQVFRSLDLTVLSIVTLLAIRSILAEIYLSKELELHVAKDILLELVLTVVFIVSSRTVDSWVTMPIYGAAYGVYLLIKRHTVRDTMHTIRTMMRA